MKLNAYLASNGVASRASWLQGAGLLRVGKQWQPSVAWPRKGHYATSFGLLSRRRGSITTTSSIDRQGRPLGREAMPL